MQLPAATSTSDVPASVQGSGRGRVKVLFVLSCERSGSTITGSLLSQVEGWFGGGEIRRLWHDLESQPTRCGCGRQPWECEIFASIGPTRLDPRCGCGRELRSCEVWPRVAAQALERAGGGLTAADIVRLQPSVVRYRHCWKVLPRLVRERRVSDWPELVTYADVTGHLFGALRDVTGCGVVVDTSKESTDAVILSMAPQVDLYVLHLVRDPRGVLYSTYRRSSPIPETGFADVDPRSARPRQAGYVSAHWMIQNLSAHVLAHVAGPGRLMRVSYEQVMRRPAHWLREITRFVGEGSPALPDFDAGSVTLRPSHTVTGNRARFRAGAVGIRADTEWVQNLHPADNAVSTALSLPLLWRYGYPLFPGWRRPNPAPA